MGSGTVAAEKHRLRVDIVKIKTPNKDLYVDVIRVVGYTASCPCGWRSTRRDTYGEARLDSVCHLAEQDA